MGRHHPQDTDKKNHTHQKQMTLSVRDRMFSVDAVTTMTPLTAFASAASYTGMVWAKYCISLL